MNEKYLFYSSCYDRELARKITILFDENQIQFKLDIKQNRNSARAPMSGGYFEADILIAEKDFEKADLILKKMENEIS